MGIPRLHLKLEGHTPSGNHKHRLAQVALAAFLRCPAPGIAVATCGHLGSSLVALCQAVGVRCRVFAPAGCPIVFEASGGMVEVRADFPGYEEAVAACDAWAAESGFLNATPGRDLASAYVRAYESVATEIMAELGTPPAALVCPVGNGTTLGGVFRGFQRLGAGLPRHFGATVRENRFASPSPPPAPLDWVTEPLRAYRPLDLAAGRRALLRSGGAAVAVTRGELEEARAALLALEGIGCHPASAAPLAALARLRATGAVGADDTVVAVLTTRHVDGG